MLAILEIACMWLRCFTLSSRLMFLLLAIVDMDIRREIRQRQDLSLTLMPFFNLPLTTKRSITSASSLLGDLLVVQCLYNLLKKSKKPSVAWSLRILSLRFRTLLTIYSLTWSSSRNWFCACSGPQTRGSRMFAFPCFSSWAHMMKLCRSIIPKNCMMLPPMLLSNNTTRFKAALTMTPGSKEARTISTLLKTSLRSARRTGCSNNKRMRTELTITKYLTELAMHPWAANQHKERLILTKS